MKKLKFASFFLAICLIFSVLASSAFALDAPEVDADTVLVADLNSGNIFYEKNMDQQRPLASLTKIMTGLLAVEAVERGDAHLTDSVTAPADTLNGLDTDSSTAGIQPGEVLTFEDLLYCAMVKSANEACNVIAVYLDGSIDAFVEHMNTRAQELGCTNTHFVDPNGLSSDNHYTTAYDLYLITKEAITHPLFMTVCDTVHYTVEPTNITDTPRELYNSNALITTDGTYGSGYLYNGASGVKTGYTSAAGYCLVSTATRDNISALVIVMGCKGPLNSNSPTYGNFATTITLYDWTFDNFAYRVILASGQEIQEAEVKYADGDAKAVLRPADNVRLLIPKDVTDSDIDISIEVYDDMLVAPIEAGTQLGTATVSISGVKYATVKLITEDDIAVKRGALIFEKIGRFFSATWIKVVFIVIVVLAAAYFALRIAFKIKRRKHLKQRMAAAQQRREEQARLEARVRARYAQQQSEQVPNAPSSGQSDGAIPVYRVDRGAQSAGRGYSDIEPEARDNDEIDLDDLIKSLGLDKK